MIYTHIIQHKIGFKLLIISLHLISDVNTAYVKHVPATDHSGLALPCESSETTLELPLKLDGSPSDVVGHLVPYLSFVLGVLSMSSVQYRNRLQPHFTSTTSVL